MKIFFHIEHTMVIMTTACCNKISKFNIKKWKTSVNHSILVLYNIYIVIKLKCKLVFNL